MRPPQAMQLYTYVEPVALEALRLDHSPRDGVGVVHICFYALLSDADGNQYNVMRGLPHPSKGSSMNFGCYRGTDVLDATGSLQISFKEAPAVEAFWSSINESAVIYQGSSFRFEGRLDGYHWTDFSGRVDLQIERIGDAFTAYVPRQELFEYPIVFTDYIGKASGTIDGIAVEGIFHDSHMYTEPDKTFLDIGFNARFENYWADWMLEYEDGSIEAGWAMKGHPEAAYTMAHHVLDGRSYAFGDGALDVSRNESGSMAQVRIAHGNGVDLTFRQIGSFDWPLHTYGALVSGTGRSTKAVVRSWNYSENWPRNWGDLERYQLAHADLFGRYPSLKGLLERSKVVDERLVFN